MARRWKTTFTTKPSFSLPTQEFVAITEGSVKAHCSCVNERRVAREEGYKTAPCTLSSAVWRGSCTWCDYCPFCLYMAFTQMKSRKGNKIVISLLKRITKMSSPYYCVSAKEVWIFKWHFEKSNSALKTLLINSAFRV